MADSSMDVAAANRFISSLSKSLQALCHGCMDFDAGIEIVGYINVNIDSGSKVDYVLNEKVLKSTTNSMTFVSNSFLAKKDQPKQCRDGACSPILELNQSAPSPFHHRARGGYSYPASQHYRSSSIFSPHSQVLRGSQKRPYNGMERDWRTSPRKHPRDSRLPITFPQQAPQEHFEPSTSNSIPLNSHFLSSQSDTTNSDLQPDISIKKEIVDDPKTGSEDSSNQKSGDGGDMLPEDVNVKEDPDSLPPREGVPKFENSTEALSQADLSSSFLQQPSADGESETKSDDPAQAKKESPSTADGGLTFGDSGENSTGGDAEAGDNYENDPNNPVTGDGGEESLGGMDADYEGSGEDTFSHQPSYSGEGASGGGQFEVIEIDDEDEDVQAMFNEALPVGRPSDQNQHTTRQEPGSRQTDTSIHHAEYLSHQRSYSQNSPADLNKLSPALAPSFEGQCSLCLATFSSSVFYRTHMNEFHREARMLPFTCKVCSKGFMSQSGLSQHMAQHENRNKFTCIVCDVTMSAKGSLRRHYEAVHSMKECHYCKSLFKTGADFNQHILSCHSRVS